MEELLDKIDKIRIKPTDSNIQVVIDDPYLKPYESDIALRIENFKE